MLNWLPWGRQCGQRMKGVEKGPEVTRREVEQERQAIAGSGEEAVAGDPGSEEVWAG